MACFLKATTKRNKNMRVVSMEHRPLRMSIDVGVGNCIKFLAAILIAFHHYSQYVISENPASANLFYQFCSSQGGYLGVAIFFFYNCIVV